MTGGDKILSVIHVELAITNYQVFCLYLASIPIGLQYATFNQLHIQTQHFPTLTTLH